MNNLNTKLALTIGALTLMAGWSAPSYAALDLAQKPLFLGVPIKPAFIMALDDSGSMNWDILSPNVDGELVWGRDTAGGTDWGFFRNAGGFRGPSDGSDLTVDWLELFPYPGRGNKVWTVPAIPHFGFARSPDFNPAYYDPAVSYLPWSQFDGTPFESMDTAAEWQSMRVDPRGTSTLRYNLTTGIRDRSDGTNNPNNQFGNGTRLNNGVVLKSGWQVISTNNDTDRTCPTSAGTLTVARASSGWTTLTADRLVTGNCNSTINVRIPANTTSSDHPEWNNRNGEFFDLRAGMVIPSGTTYFAVQPCGAIGSTTATLGVWTTLTADVTVPANGCRWNQNDDNDTTDAGDSYKLAIEYYAPTYYLTTATSPDGNTAPTTFTALAGGPRTSTTPGGGTLYRYEIKPANYATTAEYTAAMTNFANWFLYYRSRNLATIGAMTRALKDVNFMRIGVFEINETPPDLPMHEMSDFTNDSNVAGRKRLYDEILALNASGGTPNALAVGRIGQQFLRTTGTTSPTSDPPITSVCQFNAALLFTDGYNNGGHPGGVANADSTTPFHGVAPFTDSHSNTLADLAAYYYKTNLRPDLTAGLVPVPPGCAAATPDPRLDCNRNLHMNFYGITLGAAGVNFGVTHIQDPDTYVVTPDIYTAGNAPAWPAFSSSTNRTSVDDLWHATVNARGLYVNATSPERVTRAMNSIIESINNSARRSAGTAASGARRAVGFTAYVPEFDPNSWTGDLKAYQLLPNGGLGDVVWSAIDKLPAPADRNILVSRRKTDDTGYELKTFSTANLGATANDALAAMGLAAADIGTGGTFQGRTVDDIVAYLRGDSQHEGNLVGKFRPRLLGSVDGTFIHRPIGDILGSQPEVTDRASEGYSILPETEGGRVYLDGSTRKFRPADQVGTYSHFVATTKATRTPVLIVGSNGGKIHGFNAATSGTARGTEVFSVVPASVLSKLGQLPKRDYAHTYYADGSPRLGDACIGPASGAANCSWKTVATMAMGNGGRGVIALDVTDPVTSFNANNLLWEFTSAQDGDMGFVVNRPRIFVGEDKKWYAAFGNGLNSNNHLAFLYIVELKTGTVTRKIQLGTAGSATDPNGAIAVAAVDGDGDDPATDTSELNGYVDTLYATDFHGKLYKVNLSSTNPTSWALDSAGSPLYTALAIDTAERTDRRQFSTGGIDVARHPLRGNLVYYGTGRYIANGDQNIATTPQVQSFYAIWDDPNQTSGFSDRTDLQAQSITGKVTVDGVDRRTTSQNSVLYSGSTAKRGWYIDLYQAGTGGFRSGEKMLGEPRVISGQVIFTAFQPIGSECNPGGKNFLYVLSAASGTPGLTLPGCDTCGGIDLNPTGQSAPPTLTPPIVVDPGDPPVDQDGDADGDGDGDGGRGDVDCIPGAEGCDRPLPTDGTSVRARPCIATLNVLLPNAGLSPFLAFSCGRQAWRQIQ